MIGGTFPIWMDICSGKIECSTCPKKFQKQKVKQKGVINVVEEITWLGDSIRTVGQL